MAPGPRHARALRRRPADHHAAAPDHPIQTVPATDLPGVVRAHPGSAASRRRTRPRARLGRRIPAGDLPVPADLGDRGVGGRRGGRGRTAPPLSRREPARGRDDRRLPPSAGSGRVPPGIGALRPARGRGRDGRAVGDGLVAARLSAPAPRTVRAGRAGVGVSLRGSALRSQRRAALDRVRAGPPPVREGIPGVVGRAHRAVDAGALPAVRGRLDPEPDAGRRVSPVAARRAGAPPLPEVARDVRPDRPQAPRAGDRRFPHSAPTFEATAATPSRGVCAFHATPHFFSK